VTTSPVSQDDRKDASLALFNPFADGFLENPYIHYRRLRETASPYFHAALGQWLVSRYADLDAILREPRVGRGEATRFFGNFEPGSAIDRASRGWIFGMDPPEHTRLRSLFTKAFTPRRVEGLRGYVEAKTTALLDILAAAGGGDLMDSLAFHLPVAVICELLGIPEADHDECKKNSSALIALLDPIITDEQRAAAEDASAFFIDYFGRLVERRETEPGDDLVSAFLAAVAAGTPLSRQELVNNSLFLFGAGHETTSNLIGNGVYALMRFPDQWAALRADPSLAAKATAETLRWDPPVQYIGRRALEPVVLGDAQIAEGDLVMGLIGAANRDPERFDEPDLFDLTRQRNQALSFGAGIHFCVGSALARLEGETVFRELVTRFPRMSPAAPAVRRPLFAMRGYAELPVTLT
jgi:cytochrome P450